MLTKELLIYVQF